MKTIQSIKNILQIPRRGVPSGCAAITNLLPLLDHPGLDTGEERAVLLHLASCSACRERQAEYRNLERDARRYLSPQATSPRYQTEELFAAISGEDLAESSSSDAPAPIRRLHRPRRHRHLVTVLAPAASVLVVVLLATALFSGHIGGLGAGGSSLLPGSQTELDSISMVSPTEGWAVGDTQPSMDDANGTQVLLLHYLHGVWSSVSVPVAGYLYNVSMVSATDGWADGVTGFSGTLLLHYDGKTWKRVLYPPQLGQIRMLSATDGWATGNGNFVWHYDGNNWAKQPLPATLTGADGLSPYIERLTMTSAVDGWLVVNEANNSSGLSDGTVLLHYSHGQWQVSQRIEGAIIASISMASSADGWAMGSISNATPGELGVPPKPLLLHLTHGKWVQVKSPVSGTTMVAVDMRSASDGWMADVGGNAVPQLFHYNGRDWSPVRVPLTADKNTDHLQINGFALPAVDDGWAIGVRISNANQSAPLDSRGDYVPLVTPFILHYSASAWSVVPLKGIPYSPV